jgi:glycosyltransferase involved in cell wall biosynthesis
LCWADIASLREVWQDAALSVPPDEHEELTAALQLLLDDEHQRKVMRQYAKARALEFAPRAWPQTTRDLHELQECRTPHSRLPLSA